MIVLGEFEQDCMDDDDNLVKCSGWIFCSASEYDNMLSVFTEHSRKGNGLSIQMDSTHKLLFNGWALTALNAETVVSSEGGKRVYAFA